MPPRPRVLRGPVRVRLIHDLALDAFTERALAEQYDVSQPSIHEFRDKHSYQIMMARDHIESEVAGLWIAEKVNRLAELEDDVEHINEALATVPAEDRPRLYLAKHRALRNAAEELGQLAPKRVDANVTVRYEIANVDMKALE